MRDQSILDQTYRLPWKKNDNPNGWIEVTTFCQLKCPGCYRGLAEKNPLRAHEDLSKMKSEIDRLINERNIQTLSIAGGEPLLYPKLGEVISYANSRGIKTKIFTNGCALTERKLSELKSKGGTEFVIHIDNFQKRFDMKNFKNTNQLRNEYIKLFRKVKGVNLGFIMPISGEDYAEVSETVDLCKMNSDVVNHLVFTIYKELFPSKNSSFTKNRLKEASIEKVSKFLSEKYKSKPSASLGKILDKKTASWMFIMPLLYNGKEVGFFGPQVYKKIQEDFRKKKGKYLFLSRGNSIRLRSLFPFILKKGIINVFFNIFKEKLKGNNSNKGKLRYQVITVINGPNKTKDGWDLCDGCPNPMYYKGKLVPSCLLEKIKEGEKIITI